MTDAPEPSETPLFGKPLPRGPLIAIVALLLVGTGLFATGAIVKMRHSPGQPPPAVLGIAAWQIATAGFVCTLGGALWLKKLVD